MSTATFKVGIDVGGTFTDLFLWSSTGEVDGCKALSTPGDPSGGVLEGLGTLAAARGLDLRTFLGRIGTIVHGTTVTTNAVLTRGGARTGLLTTRGVRDALEMRRGIREERYDNRFRNVAPLVPRRHRLPVGGRLDYKGAEVEPLALDEVRASVAKLASEKAQAVAICFMNAFSNPAHERAALEIARKGLPGAYVCASTDILPEVRFYNRVSTTVLNAYVGPVLSVYLKGLTAELSRAGFKGVLLIMQSNGGVALPEVTAERPATTLLSGPAGGPAAALAYTEPLGRRDCIVVDMGGTSFDASLVRDGAPAMITEGEIDRLRIALPMLGIHTIGAGGGSIGWIDEGGLLRMGPRSAGAIPGPACYGRGGEEPTCTDADLVLGYLDPDYFAGGKLRLDVKASRRTIEERVGKPLKLGLEEAAAGMYRVINANMAHGVREITVRRGLDPREFPLVVAGGAGALHACMIANELEMPTLVVPPIASVLCAAGMLRCDLKHDAVRTHIAPFSRIDFADVRSLVAEMVARGAEELSREGVPGDRMRHEVALDLRYVKQYHEVTLAVPREAVERGDTRAIAAAFHVEHNRLYGYDLAAEGTDLELINVRVRSLGLTDRPPVPRIDEGSADPSAALKGRRRAYQPERMRFDEVPVYDAHRLKAGNRIPGPALIERTDTTIVVTSGFAASVDRHGSCVLERQEARR